MQIESAISLYIGARVGALALDVKLPAMPGTTVVIGPNGAGKTTLLLLVLGAIPIAQGTVCVGDSTIFDSDRGINIPLQQRRFAFVPQDYALFPHLTALGNVEFAIRSSAPNLSRRRAKEQAELALGDLGILGLAMRSIAELSGGEKQRVALARALATQPRALLLDEPLAALDVHSRRETRRFLRDYLGRLGLPSLVVSHDPEDARVLAHQVVAIESGRITQLGTYDELVSRPVTEFVRDFFASKENESVSRLRQERLRP